MAQALLPKYTAAENPAFAHDSTTYWIELYKLHKVKIQFGKSTFKFQSKMNGNRKTLKKNHTC